MSTGPKPVHILQLGAGTVGSALSRQLGQFGSQFRHDVYTSKDAGRIPGVIRHADPRFIVVDMTASDETAPWLEQALARGGSIVAANKKPFAASQDQFDRLCVDRSYFEATVGAGLPVISTLQTLLATGDRVLTIEGCFSGTLGLIFSQLSHGHSFSEAVAEAASLGFTEPDPRDDLSGVDVARKALILARLLGRRLELSDIHLEGLVPDELAALSLADFQTALPSLDQHYAQQLAAARESGQTLKYVAEVGQGTCTVGIRKVDVMSDLGNLHGPDNIVVIRTERYREQPLIIKGPGAGAEVTAAGVFGDILTAARYA
jgi:homoserine dehydrogenase